MVCFEFIQLVALIDPGGHRQSLHVQLYAYERIFLYHNWIHLCRTVWIWIDYCFEVKLKMTFMWSVCFPHNADWSSLCGPLHENGTSISHSIPHPKVTSKQGNGTSDYTQHWHAICPIQWFGLGDNPLFGRYPSHSTFTTDRTYQCLTRRLPKMKHIEIMAHRQPTSLSTINWNTWVSSTLARRFYAKNDSNQ